jgi:hypothetical protein
MATSTKRVNLVSVLALVFLVAVIAVTPEARQLMSRFAFWMEGVEEKLAADRRQREAPEAEWASEARGEPEKGEETLPPELPPHIVVGADGGHYPEPGYKWVNADPNDKRVVWSAGSEHPQHKHVLASNEPDQWRPAPGYDWTEASGVNDMRVVWTPGKRHPDQEHVIAVEKEGEWRPEQGWKWVNDDPHDLSVTPEAGDG